MALGRSWTLRDHSCDWDSVRNGWKTVIGKLWSAPTKKDLALSHYEAIDQTLADWAEANGQTWYREYQDTEVRTFFLAADRRDRVQVAVDAPQGERTVIRVGQNRKGLSRLARLADFPTPVADLPQALDRALQTAKEWLAEDDRSVG